MRPGQITTLHDRWTVFSQGVHEVDRKYLNTGLTWFNVPPTFRQMYVIHTGPGTIRCDDDFKVLLDPDGEARTIPAIIADLQVLHRLRDTARRDIYRGDDTKARASVERGELMLRTIRLDVEDLTVHVNHHRDFFLRVQPVVEIPVRSRDTTSRDLRAWHAALPENANALRMGLLENPVDALESDMNRYILELQTDDEGAGDYEFDDDDEYEDGDGDGDGEGAEDMSSEEGRASVWRTG